MIQKWGEPDAREVKEAYDQVAAAEANVRLAEYELDNFEAKMALRYPKNVAARKIGMDEETGIEALKLRRAVLEAKNNLKKWEMLVKYLEYAKDMYKTETYKVNRA